MAAAVKNLPATTGVSSITGGLDPRAGDPGRVFALGFEAPEVPVAGEPASLAGALDEVFSLSVMCWGLIAQKPAGH
jgi:hypothetical protein